jgi:hypothetical protein
MSSTRWTSDVPLKPLKAQHGVEKVKRLENLLF